MQSEHGELHAVLKGCFYKEHLDFPVIGDYVELKENPYGDSVITAVEPRHSVFSRANFSGHAAGYVKTIKGQAMAANFDYVFIATSLNQNFNLNRIARYISVTLQGNAVPVVVLTKADLCDNPENYILQVKELSDKVEVFAVSSITGAGMELLSPYMKAGVTIVLLGSSGVGKSTLINALAGEALMLTSAIREEDGRGRHTTTHRELFTLPSGVTIIDTPGLRELGMFEVEDGIDETFPDILELMSQCRFSNCTHRNEPGCAVQNALKTGSLTQKRYDLYQSLHAETAFGRSKAAKNL